MFITAVFLSPIYNFFVVPEIQSLLHLNSQLSVHFGTVVLNTGSFNDTIIFIMLIILLAVAIFGSNLVGSSVNIKNIYLCGENNDSENNNSFRNGLGQNDTALVSNFYFSKVFNESTFTKLGYFVSISLILLSFVGGLI